VFRLAHNLDTLVPKCALTVRVVLLAPPRHVLVPQQMVVSWEPSNVSMEVVLRIVQIHLLDKTQILLTVVQQRILSAAQMASAVNRLLLVPIL